MRKLQFSQDEGTLFYKELREKVDAYFLEKGTEKTGNRLFKGKMFMYFTLDIIF